MQINSFSLNEASLPALKALVEAVATAPIERTSNQLVLLENLTEAQLNALQERALKDASKLKKQFTAVRVVAGLFVASVLLLPLSPVLKQFVLQHSLEYVGIFLGAALFGSLLMGVGIWNDTYVSSAVQLLEKLSPGELSSEAFALTQRFAACEGYRKQVLAQKRPFRVLDLEVLKSLAKTYGPNDHAYVAEFAKLTESSSQGWR